MMQYKIYKLQNLISQNMMGMQNKFLPTFNFLSNYPINF